MSYEIKLHREAVKFLKELDGKTQERIKNSIRELIKNPFENRAKADIKKLKGTKGRKDAFRLRIGDFRVVYDVEENVVWITNIFRREGGYK